jgi:hypothetical protein
MNLITTIKLSANGAVWDLLVTENALPIALVGDVVEFDIPGQGLRNFRVDTRSFVYGANGGVQTVVVTLNATIVP